MTKDHLNLSTDNAQDILFSIDDWKVTKLLRQKRKN